MPAASFNEILSAALADLEEHGYDSAERVAFWTQQLREAATKAAGSQAKMHETLQAGLNAIYRRMVDRGTILQRHPGVSRFTLSKVSPQLRAELSRRIMASASLIKLNRDEAIEKTLRRFQGWATSLPAGGSNAVDKKKERENLKKSLKQLPFEERRVLIDQGHKLTAALHETLAKDADAIALIWHSHWRQANYDYREDHKERDGQVYLIKGSWAREQGLVKPGDVGYYDDVTSVGEEPFCRCYAQYLYALRDLPKEMLTKKGAAALAGVRIAA